MKNTMPKVSIIMGIYNCEDTLSEAIDSILNQSYSNWELIMCDDCSSDNTFEIAQRYKELYPDKIKLIRNETNLTLAPTLNKCINISEGKYIARHDGDDLSHKDRLTKQVEFLEKNKVFDLVGTSMIAFDDNNRRKGVHRLKSIPIKEDLLYGTTFSHPTIMIKSEVIKILNGYCEKEYAKQLEDFELWIRFFEHGFKGINIEDELYFYREDNDAYKRRLNKSRRIRGLKLGVITRKRLNLPKYSYIYMLKDILAIIVPSFIIECLYKKRLQNNN